VLIQVRAFDPAGLASVVLEGTGTQDLAYNQNSGMYESGVDSTLLKDGTYRYTARSTDLAGRVTESSVWLRSDNTAPALSVSAPEDGDHITGVMAVVAEAPDAFPTVIEYQVDSLGWRAGNSTLDTALLSDGPHALAVRATDASGKASEARLVIRTDNTPPVVSILEPSASGVAVAGTFTLRMAVSEPDTVAGASYSLDGGHPLPLMMNRATGYYEQAVPTGALADELVHNISVTVTSLAGLETTVTRPFRVDNTPPVVTVRSPGNIAQKGTVVISVDIADQTGVSDVEVRLDGGAWKEMSVTRTPGRYEYKWPTGVAQNGAHSFEVRTQDSLGNRGTTVYTFKVDNPDYWPVVLVVLVVLTVVGGVMLVARGRRRRGEELLPPVEEPPGPAKPQGPEEFPGGIDEVAVPEAKPVEEDEGK
jgi:hypothetical protein